MTRGTSEMATIRPNDREEGEATDFAALRGRYRGRVGCSAAILRSVLLWKARSRFLWYSPHVVVEGELSFDLMT
jgi:hypothetical protein